MGEIIKKLITFLKSLHFRKKVLSPAEVLLLKDPWYHNFAVLGVPTCQKTGIYKPNQECKQELIFKFINHAISYCSKNNRPISGVELFCADGFYANYAIKHGADKMHGVDISNHSLSKARLITKLVGNNKKISFAKCDVFKLSGVYDFGICAGGLYHLSTPEDLLRLLRKRIRSVLVIQTVYSLANTSENYFETPAPDSTWGCRFSYPYLLQMVNNSGWITVEASTNQLKANKHLKNRGSAYLLCVPAKNETL